MAGRPPRNRRVPAKMGAPTKCTPQVIEAFAEAYKQGHNIESSAIIAGIHYDTAMKWWRKGEAGEEPYTDFVYKSMVARKMAAYEAAKIARKEKPTWWLERVEHQDFGRKDRIEHDHKSGGMTLREAIRQSQIAAGYDPDDPRDVIILPKKKDTNGTGGNGT